jgi:hypothetical protein
MDGLTLNGKPAETKQRNATQCKSEIKWAGIDEQKWQ